jgi:zinc transport system substrate-binding protein
VNYPLEYFAERIGGQLLQVEFPAPTNVDPAFWMPDPEVITGYQSSSLILLNGATYAKWIDKASLPESRLIFTSDDFDDELIPLQGTVTHTHGPGGEHSHEGTAFTTWLDPTLAVQQAETIRQAFSVEWPEHAAEFQAGFESLQNDLMELDRRLSETVGAAGGPPLLASHPVYQYLTRRYGLNVRSVQWEPGEAPGASMWRDLRTILRDHPAQWMLWEDTPLPETARQLRALGVEPVVFHPCGNRPLEGDYLNVMRENVSRLAAVFGRD